MKIYGRAFSPDPLMRVLIMLLYFLMHIIYFEHVASTQESWELMLVKDA